MPRARDRYCELAHYVPCRRSRCQPTFAPSQLNSSRVSIAPLPSPPPVRRVSRKTLSVLLVHSPVSKPTRVRASSIVICAKIARSPAESSGAREKITGLAREILTVRDGTRDSTESGKHLVLRRPARDGNVELLIFPAAALRATRRANAMFTAAPAPGGREIRSLSFVAFYNRPGIEILRCSARRRGNYFRYFQLSQQCGDLIETATLA